MFVVDEKMMFKLREYSGGFISLLHGSSMGITGSIDCCTQGDRKRDDHCKWSEVSKLSRICIEQYPLGECGGIETA